ncbi:MAG: Fe-S cluster assembly protein SufD [Candidatus Krumholzibacteriia bacterium]
MVELGLLLSVGKPAVAKEDARRLSRLLGEAPEGAAWRLRALETYRDLPVPDRVQHLWRYTDPRDLLPEQPLSGDLAAVGRGPELPADGPAVLLVPGREPQLNAAAADLDVTVSPLLHTAGDVALAGGAVPPQHGLFEALNAAVFNTGALVRIGPGVRLGEPLRVIVAAVAAATLPRLLIVAEGGSEATIVEEHVGGGEGVYVVGVSEALVRPNAQLRHVLVQNWSDGTAGHLTQRGLAERDGRYLAVTATFGGRRAKLDVGGILDGPGARSELVGVTLGEKRQHFDHHTLHQHRSGRTWSNIDYKVALTGRSRSVYTGLIRIEEGAPQSEAYQENRNLLLSDRCRADAIPELEILTDDVSCSHGATATPVDPEQLFYLESRGIDPDTALRLVVRGFLETTLAALPETLRSSLEDMVERRLDGLVGGR